MVSSCCSCLSHGCGVAPDFGQQLLEQVDKFSLVHPAVSPRRLQRGHAKLEWSGRQSGRVTASAPAHGAKIPAPVCRADQHVWATANLSTVVDVAGRLTLVKTLCSICGGTWGRWAIVNMCCTAAQISCASMKPLWSLSKWLNPLPTI